TIYCVPSSFQIMPITSIITRGAELPTAEQILLKEITVSLSLRLGVRTNATLLIESPKLVATAQRTAIVVTYTRSRFPESAGGAQKLSTSRTPHGIATASASGRNLPILPGLLPSIYIVIKKLRTNGMIFTSVLKSETWF